MVTLDMILNEDGKEVYTLIYQWIMTDPPNSKKLIDTLKESERYEEDSYFRISVDSANMVAHGLNGEHDAVIAMAPEIIERTEALEMLKLLATNWNNLGTTYAIMQNLERSLECYCHLVNIETKHGYHSLRSVAYYNLSAIFYQVGGHEKSVEYIELAVESLQGEDMDDPVIRPRYLM
ncbi:MAG: tetratricopeptide repeat protein, partial [Bacillota bacterium]|nr:tetratricopeptide repeat protein [Bacillota bacterium]